MPQIFNVTLNYDEIVSQAKKGHAAFFRSKAKAPFFGATIWVNDEPDQFGHDVKVTLNPGADKKGKEPKIYIGNGYINKSSAKKTGRPRGKTDDGLPF